MHTKNRLVSVDVGAISRERFVAGWTKIVGEPPAAMLDDRRAMIVMLVQEAGYAHDEGPARSHLHRELRTEPGGR